MNFEQSENLHNSYFMKVTGAGAALLVAAMTISVVAGFSICAIDIHFYDTNKQERYGYRSVWKTVLDLSLSCGIFGAARAIVSLSAIVILCLSGCVSPVAVVIVAAISAGLYFGELIPGSMLISESYLGTDGAWRSTADMIYIDDPEYLEWVDTYTQRQGEYSYEGNDWWGTAWQSPTSKWPRQFGVPTSYNWSVDDPNGPVVSVDKGRGVYSCIVNYNVSKTPNNLGQATSIPNLGSVYVQDCDNIDLVVVDCLSGWDEASLNSEVKRLCKERNQEFFDSTRPVETPTPLEQALEQDKYEVMTVATESTIGMYYFNSILIALETASFVLALVGILLVALGGLCSGKSAKSTHSSSKDKSSSLSDVAAKEEVVVWSADPAPPQPEPQYQPPPQAEPQYQPPPQPEPQNEPAEQPLEDQHDSSSTSDSSSASSTSS